jgi:hypothetical protein
LLGLRPDRELYVELAADPEAFGLAVFAAPDSDPSFAVNLSAAPIGKISSVGPVFFIITLYPSQ